MPDAFHTVLTRRSFALGATLSPGESGSLLADMAGTGDWRECMRFRSSANADDVSEWLAGPEV